ncbi:unnamed protein product [Penicillium camemberti]|uniref:Str. FM013 n=1 Tax=Penicillium camemberti (strain FM 013) TaxID=1429867 RepID=A0A0G4PD54_PENC3|nr:unnamed protein product [Penicillium camemberti]
MASKAEFKTDASGNRLYTDAKRDLNAAPLLSILNLKHLGYFIQRCSVPTPVANSTGQGYLIPIAKINQTTPATIPGVSLEPGSYIHFASGDKFLVTPEIDCIFVVTPQRQKGTSGV